MEIRETGFPLRRNDELPSIPMRQCRHHAPSVEPCGTTCQSRGSSHRAPERAVPGSDHTPRDEHAVHTADFCEASSPRSKRQRGPPEYSARTFTGASRAGRPCYGSRRLQGLLSTMPPASRIKTPAQPVVHPCPNSETVTASERDAPRPHGRQPRPTRLSCAGFQSLRTLTRTFR